MFLVLGGSEVWGDVKEGGSGNEAVASIGCVCHSNLSIKFVILTVRIGPVSTIMGSVISFYLLRCSQILEKQQQQQLTD